MLSVSTYSLLEEPAGLGRGDRDLLPPRPETQARTFGTIGQADGVWERYDIGHWGDDGGGWDACQTM
jgi:hypothetical protein